VAKKTEAAMKITGNRGWIFACAGLLWSGSGVLRAVAAAWIVKGPPSHPGIGRPAK
jgi:hypothetical protein